MRGFSPMQRMALDGVVTMKLEDDQSCLAGQAGAGQLLFG